MKRGFTLIELLIVIAIVAVLAIAIVIILNPAELLKQARDSTRLSDLDNLNKAIALFSVQDPAGSIGDSDKIYVSLPDTDNQDPAECDEYTTGGLLPLPPATFSYVCKKIDDYRKINGNGWIPINFETLAAGPPLSILPVDPVNTVANGLYFTYVRGGSWKLTALFESQKKAKVMASDGGPDVGIYEVGTNLNLVNGIRGLIAYWKMDEVAWSPDCNTLSVIDSSGVFINNHGKSCPSASGPILTVPGRLGNAGSFDGNDDYIQVNNVASWLPTSKITVSAWVNIANLKSSGQWNRFVNHRAWTSDGTWLLYGDWNGSVKFGVRNCTPSCSQYEAGNSGQGMVINTWYHVVGTYDGSNVNVYLNGNPGVPRAFPGENLDNSQDVDMGGLNVSSNEMNGLIDDVRIYNRALSASEIQALYNATKP